MYTQQVNYEQLAVWNPRTEQATYTNPTGGTLSILIGTLMGRVVGTNKVLPQVSTATDGSQVPIGVLLETTGDVLTTASRTVTILVKGDMNYSQLVFGGADTLATNVSVGGVDLGTINDILVGKGILPIASTNVTQPDNS